MKKIKYKRDGVMTMKEFDFEELIQEYNGMIIEFANNCVIKTKNVYNNIMDFDDFYNLGLERLYYCFVKYKPTDCFSTYLFYGLNMLEKDIYKSVFAKKKHPNMNLVYWDTSFNEDNNLTDKEGALDNNLLNVDLLQDFKKIINKFTKEEIEIFNFLLFKDTSKKDLATKLNISRPTLNQRIVDLEIKLKNIFIDYINI